MQEIWKPVSEAPNYEVSNFGRVKNAKYDRLLTPSNKKGYRKVGLRVDGHSITRSVHQLVAQVFVEGFHALVEVNHKDGNKANNHFTNLEWTTHSENMIHAVITGLFKPPGGRPRKAVRIIETGEVFDSLSECAMAIDGHHGCIQQCIDGRQKSHKGYTFEYI